VNATRWADRIIRGAMRDGTNPSRRDGSNPIPRNGTNPSRRDESNPIPRNGTNPIPRNESNPSRRNEPNSSKRIEPIAPRQNEPITPRRNEPNSPRRNEPNTGEALRLVDPAIPRRWAVEINSIGPGLDLEDSPVSSTGPPAGLGSVIVKCGGRLDLTRRCIAALVGHTRSPWELIALEDGVSIETAAYLAGLRDGSSVRVEVVPAPGGGDLGQLLEVARGHYLVMVDVEAVVTEGWP
jgi:hypothetical protein